MEPNSNNMEIEAESADMVDFEMVDFEDEAQVSRALHRAIAATLRSHKAKGQYVVGSRNGKPVIIPPEDIVVPEVPD